jgi:hypothetical protein
MQLLHPAREQRVRELAELVAATTTLRTLQQVR